MRRIIKTGLAAIAFLGIAGAGIAVSDIDPAAAQGRGGGNGGGFDRGNNGGGGGRGGYDRGGPPPRQMERPQQRQPLDFSSRPDRRVYNERQEQWRPSRPSFFGR